MEAGGAMLLDREANERAEERLFLVVEGKWPKNDRYRGWVRSRKWPRRKENRG
jgi:hypothetical protein